MLFCKLNATFCQQGAVYNRNCWYYLTVLPLDGLGSIFNPTTVA